MSDRHRTATWIITGSLVVVLSGLAAVLELALNFDLPNLARTDIVAELARLFFEWAVPIGTTSTCSAFAFYLGVKHGRRAEDVREMLPAPTGAHFDISRRLRRWRPGT